MYNFIRSYTKDNSVWTLNDIKDETVDFILDNFESVRIVATWDTDTNEFEIHMNDLRMELFLTDTTQKVVDWLGSFTENTLKTRPKVTRLSEVRTVKFKDLHTYNLSYKPGNHLYGPGIVVPKNTDNDLECFSDLPEYDERSMRNLAKNAVITVNGHCVKTIYEHGKLWGVGASKHLNKDVSNIFSIIDFTDIGGCEKAYPTEDTVRIALRTMDEERAYITRAVIDTKVSMQKRTPVLVMDGHLYIGEEWIKPISDTEVVINVRHDVVLQRANNSKLEDLGFVDPANARNNGIDALTLDVQKLLLETDTFVLLLNTDELCVQRERLGATKIEGFYTHYRAPVGLCFFENGKLAPYNYTDYNAWTVCLGVGNNVRRNMLSDTISWSDVKTMWDVERENPVDHFMEAEIVDLYVF